MFVKLRNKMTQRHSASLFDVKQHPTVQLFVIPSS